MSQGLHNLSGSGRAIDVGRKLYPKDKLENRKKCLIKKLSYIVKAKNPWTGTFILDIGPEMFVITI